MTVSGCGGLVILVVVSILYMEPIYKQTLVEPVEKRKKKLDLSGVGGYRRRSVVWVVAVLLSNK